ncbi:hypothetical protein FALCPG4_004483 [Fusarium falciforme]
MFCFFDCCCASVTLRRTREVSHLLRGDDSKGHRLSSFGVPSLMLLPEAMTNTTTMRAVHRGCPLTQTLKPPKPPPHLAYDSRSAVFEPSSIVCRASINRPWDINPTPRHLPSGGSGPAAKPQTTGRFFRRISLSGQPLASSRRLLALVALMRWWLPRSPEFEEQDFLVPC